MGMERVRAITRHMLPAPVAGDGVTRVAVVTGGSRGIGRGCVLALAKSGVVVYVTGRSVDAALAQAMADEAGVVGSVVALPCDHADDASTVVAFEQVIRERGRIDILVNNATQGAAPKGGGKFWEQDPAFYDGWNNVGLRSHFVCSSLAARDMVRRGEGLIVSISSFGAVKPYNSVAYAMGKTAIDRMTADAALELAEHNVAMVSLYPGLVKTEGVLSRMGDRVRRSRNAEWPEFIGRAVVALAADPAVSSKSGKVLICQELADEYGFSDVEGHVPKDKVMRGLRAEMARPPKHWVL